MHYSQSMKISFNKIKHTSLLKLCHNYYYYFFKYIINSTLVNAPAFLLSYFSILSVIESD